jgi:hypothetical protein
LLSVSSRRFVSTFQDWPEEPGVSRGARHAASAEPCFGFGFVQARHLDHSDNEKKDPKHRHAEDHSNGMAKKAHNIISFSRVALNFE